MKRNNNENIYQVSRYLSKEEKRTVLGHIIFPLLVVFLTVSVLLFSLPKVDFTQFNNMFSVFSLGFILLPFLFWLVYQCHPLYYWKMWQNRNNVITRNEVWSNNFVSNLHNDPNVVSVEPVQKAVMRKSTDTPLVEVPETRTGVSHKMFDLFEK